MRAALLLLCAGSWAACSSRGSDGPPIIDRIDMPSAVPVDATGKATLQGQVWFHDDHDPVTTLVLELPKTGGRASAQLMPAEISGSTTLTMTIPGMKGAAVDYRITATDARGLTSTPALGTVALQ